MDTLLEDRYDDIKRNPVRRRFDPEAETRNVPAHVPAEARSTGEPLLHDDIESDPDVVRAYMESKAGKGERLLWEDIRDEFD